MFWLELVLMMLVAPPFRWANKALPSLLDYRDRMSERKGASGIDKHEGDSIEEVAPYPRPWKRLVLPPYTDLPVLDTHIYVIRQLVISESFRRFATI